MSRLQHRTMRNIVRASAAGSGLRGEPFVAHLNSDNAEDPTLSVFCEYLLWNNVSPTQSVDKPR